MATYDIGEAFQIIEEEMIASMTRNLKRHLKTEHEEGLNYSMWQAEQLASLNNYRKNNKKQFTSYFNTINGQIEDVLRKAYETGEMDQEAAILEAIKKGARIYNRSAEKTIRGQFFTINEKKLNALIKATKKDMAKAETAMLRMADDEYRKVIFNSQVYYNTGAGTLSQCVDMATKDFLAKGINCIEYANGARVPIDAYASMALRTTQTRAYLHGESSKRDEWGVNTVIVNKRGVACPRCLRYVGKVFYDDVWGNVPVPSPAKYPRLSDAIAGGLYHPNCKDIHTTYFEGITTPPKPMTEDEKKEAARVYNLEQRQRYNERQIRKYKRLYQGSLDPENKTKYLEKLEEWQDTQRNFVKANGDVLKRRYENEKLRVADFPEPPKTNSSKNIDFSKNSDIIEAPEIQIGKSVGAKAQNYDIELPNKEIVHLTEGTRVTNIQTIAGKGRDREIDEIEILLERFGGSASEWQKKKGLGYVDYDGEIYHAELHWYEEPTVGKHKWKVKPDADGNWFIDD